MKTFFVLALFLFFVADGKPQSGSSWPLDMWIKSAELGRPTKFRVGQVGNTRRETRDELIRLFGIFQAQYSSIVQGEIIPVEPFGPKPTLVTIEGTVHQHAGDNVYLVSAFTNAAEDPILLRGLSGVNWLERQQIKILAYPAGIKDWTSAGSAARRSPFYHAFDPSLMVPHANSPSREVFLEAINTGATFPVVDLQLVPCANCLGKGKYRGRAELKQSPDRFYECSICGTTGKVREFQLVELCW